MRARMVGLARMESTVCVARVTREIGARKVCSCLSSCEPTRVSLNIDR